MGDHKRKTIENRLRAEEKKKEKEDICLRCGTCCRLKGYEPNFDAWFALDQYCIHFERIEDDNGKKLGNCKIYDKVLNGQTVMDGVKCISAERQVEARLQPATCVYSKKIPGYQCRVINW